VLVFSHIDGVGNSAVIGHDVHIVEILIRAAVCACFRGVRMLQPPRMRQPPCLKLLTASCSAVAEVAVCRIRIFACRHTQDTNARAHGVRSVHARHFTFTDALIKDDGKQLLLKETERRRTANKSAILFLE